MTEQLRTFTNFGLLDWLIVFTFLVASAIAGLWSKRYIRNLESFLMPAGACGVTWGGQHHRLGDGLVTVMYSAQKGFTGGFAAFHIALAAAVVALVVGSPGSSLSPCGAPA